MFIYGPSVTENIELQNNENLEIFKQEVEKQSYCPIIELLKNKHI